MADVWRHRWRVSGINFEGRAWHVTKPIIALIDEIGPVWPEGHPLDGTSASSSHATNSDHYPDDGGEVRALDVGENVEDRGATLAEALRTSRDPRLKYVIHERRLFSSYVGPNGEPPWEWRPYRGSSEHLEHVHVSVLESADDDGGPWGLRLEETMPPTAKENAAEVWGFGSAEHSPLTMQRLVIRTYVATNLLLKRVAGIDLEIDDLADAIASAGGIDPAALADTLAAELGPDLAADLADELHRRLAPDR